MGREPWDDDRLEFIRQYLLHVFGLRSIRAIACAISQPYEGAASQALQVMNTITLAHAYGLRYVHRPFTAIAHADRPMVEWVAAWETFFNLGVGETTYDAEEQGVLNAGTRLLDLELVFGSSEVRQALENCFRSLIPEFRRRFYLNKTPRVTPEINVAVHIRRGDVSATKFSHMYTDSEIVLRITSAVKSSLISHQVPYRMCIYGQGNIGEYSELSSLGAEYFLDADPIWTLQELVEADILIVAKSCYSHYAGLMSDGIKIFEESWKREYPATLGDRRLDRWLPCDTDGSFDLAAFERQLSQLLSEKTMALGRQIR